MTDGKKEAGRFRRWFGFGSKAAPEPGATETDAVEPDAAEADSVEAEGLDQEARRTDELRSGDVRVDDRVSDESAADTPIPVGLSHAEQEVAVAASVLDDPTPVEEAELPLAGDDDAGSESDLAPDADAGGRAKRNWFQRLTEGLRKSSQSLSTGITDIFTKRKLDDDTLQDLEDILIQADLGVDAAARITERVASGRYNKQIEPDEVKSILAAEVAEVLRPVAQPLRIDRQSKPFVIMMVGVNGTGKTTTMGKLAAQLRSEGRSVMLAAGDTFRAAAIEQLKVWGERVGAPVVASSIGADAAGLAYEALQRARDEGTDVLMIDTAGRLQNKAGLMAELQKIVRVIRKQDESAPHAVLLVLDATTGQNAISQVETFHKMTGVTGLVMTKLDGTARGGILVAVAEKFGLPIHAIGVGESVADLQPFEADEFARSIAGLG